MIAGTCLCGAVTFEVPMAPSEVTVCNCEACRRLGPLWAYYQSQDVKMAGVTVGYERHDIPGQDGPMLAFHHCPTCGCITHWADLVPTEKRMAVNARLIDPKYVEAAKVRHFDGAASWTNLDSTK